MSGESGDKEKRASFAPSAALTGLTVGGIIGAGGFGRIYDKNDAVSKVIKQRFGKKASRGKMMAAGAGIVGPLAGLAGYVGGKLSDRTQRQYEELSARDQLRLICFGSDDPPPPVEGFNPFERYRRRKMWDRYVATRKPSADVSLKDVVRQYPPDYDLRNREAVGGAIGAGIGMPLSYIGAKALLPKKKAVFTAPLAALGGAAGYIAGARLAGGEKRRRLNEELGSARKEVMRVFKAKGDEAVDVKSVKGLPVPVATGYGEVVRELKSQGVDPVTRHAAAALSRPYIWTGTNAVFVPRGNKGLVITTKMTHPLVLRHEVGHAKDYQYYGGRDGFLSAYGHNPLEGKRGQLRSVMLPEYRAWAHAKPRTEEEKRLRDAALRSYAAAIGADH